MRSKLLIVLLVSVAWFAQANAQSPIDAIRFGSILGQDVSPQFGYIIGNTFSLKPLGGMLFEEVEGSLVYSDQRFIGDNEVYGGRLYLGRRVVNRKLYVGLAGGTWAMVNTDGGDHARVAFKIQGGVNAGNLDLSIAAEIVSLPGPDRYFISVGFRIFDL